MKLIILILLLFCLFVTNNSEIQSEPLKETCPDKKKKFNVDDV